MQTKRTFITEAIAEQIELHKFNLQDAKIIPKQTAGYFKKIKDKEGAIYIYDLGFNKHKKIIPINNHINKTGENPLRKTRQNKIIFYDITKIYQRQKAAKTAECFGDKQPKEKNNNNIQTRFLCNYVISAYCQGIKNIFAYVID